MVDTLLGSLSLNGLMGGIKTGKSFLWFKLLLRATVFLWVVYSVYVVITSFFK